MEGGGQILPAYTPETGAEYRAKNREIKSRDRFFVKENIRLLPCSSFSEKGHGKSLGSLASAFAFFEVFRCLKRLGVFSKTVDFFIFLC